MKKGIIALIIAPIVGAALGYLLTDAINSGWFSSEWQQIESPPSNVHRLVAVSKGSLWVENNAGVFYHSEDPSSCESECWQEVAEIPSLPIVEPYEFSVTDQACAPSPPLSKVIARISECRKETWIDRNSTFALRNDGSLYLWQVDLYKEWSAALLILDVCAGAVILFVPTLIIVLFNWLLNRSNEKQREKHPSLPNTACTRRVGVAAFSGVFRGFRFILLPGVTSSRPPAGNAPR